MSQRALVYLHGFASSPRSSKARFFAQRAAALGWACTCPDLNEPDFTALTVSRMIDRVEGAIEAHGAGPVALVGSSLGAFVAVHAAARRHERGAMPPVDRLVLLAPALALVSSLEENSGRPRWGPGSTAGPAGVHYGDDAARARVGLHARRAPVHSDAVQLDLPIMIYQGRARPGRCSRRRRAMGRPPVRRSPCDW